MTFPFEEEIILENAFALLRPLQIPYVDVLHSAISDPTLLQFHQRLYIQKNY